MISKQLLSSKTVLILLAAFALFFGNLKFQQVKQQRAIEREKQTLIQQQDKLTSGNKDLEGSLAYLTSNDFKERVARQQLNMKKDGEVVYNFSETGGQQTNMETQNSAESSNTKKWWNYFFSEPE